MATPSRKVIITCAVTGSIHTPTMTPHLPITPKQIADESIAAAKAGAAIIHLHVLDESGRAKQDTIRFAAPILQIRKRCDVILQTSTGATVGKTVQDRAAPHCLTVSEAPEM